MQEKSKYLKIILISPVIYTQNVLHCMKEFFLYKFIIRQVKEFARKKMI